MRKNKKEKKIEKDIDRYTDIPVGIAVLKYI